MKIGIQMGKMGLLASLILVFFYCLNLAESKRSKSACYYYGHSCWGGHGKRSGNEGLLAANKMPGFVSSPVLQILMKNKGNSNSLESLLTGHGEPAFGLDIPFQHKNSRTNIKRNLLSDEGKISNGKSVDEVNDDKGAEELDEPPQDSDLVSLSSAMQNKRGNEAELVGSNDRLGSDYDSTVGIGNSMNNNLNINSGATEEEVPIYYPSSSAAASSEIFSRNNRIRDRVGNHNNVKDKTSGKPPGGNMILFRWLPVQKNQ